MPEHSSTSSSSSPRRGALRAIGTVAILVALGIAAAYAASQAISPIYGSIRARGEAFARVAPTLEAVSIGNSHAGAIDHAALGLRGFRLSSPGADLFETNRDLDHVLASSPRLRVVFVSASTFVGDNGASPLMQHRREASYYQFRDFRPIRGEWSVAFRALLLPVARPDHWRAIFWPGPQSGPESLDEGLGDEPWPATAAERVAEARERQQRLVARETEARSHVPTLCADTRAALEDMAQATRRRGVRLVLFTPPYHPAFIDAFEATPNPCPASDLARALAASSDGVTYVDARRLEGFGSDSDLFHNADHLTHEGAVVFSHWLRDEIRLSPPLPDDARPA